MGDVRVSRRKDQARLGYVASCVVLVVGLYLAVGLAAALVAGGAIGAVSFLLLYDVSDDRRDDVREPASVRPPTF